MIIKIMQLLKYCDGDTENIRIAQGKNKLPDTFKEGYQLANKLKRWNKYEKL